MRRWLGAVAGAVTAAVVLAAVSGGGTAEDVDVAPVAFDVLMPVKSSRPGCEEADMCYIPSTVTAGVGQPVVWMNRDVAFHSITSGSYGAPTGLFDSGHLDPDEAFSVTFEEPGRYNYFCTLHPWMEGEVMIKGEEGI